MKQQPNYEWLKDIKEGDKVRFNDPEGVNSGGYTVFSFGGKEGVPTGEDTFFTLTKDSGKLVSTTGRYLAPATVEHFSSVWDALCDTPEEASQMKALSEAKMWFDAMAKNHPEPLTMNAQTGGALLTSQIHRINMAMLFAVCRANKIDTESLEKICRNHNQPIPAAQ